MNTEASFRTMWAIFGFILLAFAAWAGKKSQFNSFLGILIDVRERYSLNRFQLVMWTLLILSSFLGLLFGPFLEWLTGTVTLTKALQEGLPKAFNIGKELLGLLGISVTSATIAGAVKDNKNLTRPESISGGGRFAAASNAPSVPPRLLQIILEEEGQGANKIISVSKFQNFIFTVALGVVYIALTATTGKYPVFDQQILWLIGISHAGYVGGKIPDKK
jgi:hypothetical protein